jgi:hypothetical protein
MSSHSTVNEIIQSVRHAKAEEARREEAADKAEMRKQIERLQKANADLRACVTRNGWAKKQRNEERWAMKQELLKTCEQRGFTLAEVYTSRDPSKYDK